MVININTASTLSIGSSLGATQILNSDPDSLKEAEQKAIDCGLAVVDLTECIKLLKEHYNITTDLIIVKTDKDPTVSTVSQTTSTTSKAVSVNIYDPTTRKKLDMSICNDVDIKTPMTDKSQLQQYQDMKDRNIDIFDPNDPAFTDRCFQYVDNTTGMDTTLNWRIKNYLQNNTISCSSRAGTNCTYRGIDDNGYVICKCAGTVVDDDVSNDFVNFLADTYSSLNLDIVRCYNQVFNLVYIN
jgi:hypothetical protein